MSWTYSGDPAASNKDAVRFLIGQTSSADDVVTTDEEIGWALSQRNSNLYAAGALVCQGLASRYAANPTAESVGELGLTWGDRAERFRARAKELRAEIAHQGVSPYVGGRSISDKQTDETDTDLAGPAFKLGMFDNPSAIGSTST